MRKGWTYRKLGDICSSELGKTLNQSKDTGQLKPYLCSINVQWDHIDLSTVKQARFEDTDDERYSVTAGDLLVCEGGDIGRAAIWSSSESMLYQNALHRIRFNDSYLPRFYLHYLHFLKTNGTLDAQYGKGVTIKHLVKSSLMSIPVPVPPLAEQESIVAELDLLQGIIDKQKAQLKELDTLAQSIFYDMFGDPVENEKGWQTIALKDAVLEMFLGPFGSALKTECYVNKEDSFCMVYEQKHAIRKTMNVETHYIDKEKFGSLKRFEVHSGDFIMSCRGTIGEIYRLPEDAPIGIIHPSLMKIRIKEDVYSPTFFLWLLSRIIKNESTNGNCVQMAITAKELGTRTPIYPPLPLQQSFATKIKAIERQKASINASIAETQKLFDYTMDKYFG